MFTIEHDFDATVITLIDEPQPGDLPGEDVVVHAHEDGVTVEQSAPDGTVARVILTAVQLRELRAALDLPEGSYRLERRPAAGQP